VIKSCKKRDYYKGGEIVIFQDKECDNAYKMK
jgi:hypothetical protein